ncbi:thiamine phosphate synthase [Ancylomarina salipaludis]|uniref:Thiamine-phosphate synthase n=1 Tax=Ancylomarina salipaludis TaxID=2501299 RepID=A0A4Q1JPB7_9BACT|nr:thiamine phosphate synthase [Ancylomarina salipaludis]RXQ96095.1 thiamine phosphate synthase [Ancylomarina salipaludis]
MTPIVITPEEILTDEVRLWEALFQSGLQRLHVRKPQASISDLRNMLNDLEKQYHSRVILHQHHILAEEFNLGGIHFKSVHQTDEYPIKRQNISRSRSCHTPLEVLNHYKTHDYVFLSPIYNSISKQGYPSAFYPNEIQTLFQDHPEIKNCIALGGINKTNVQDCLDLGFMGCALLGSIWEGKHLSPELVSKRFCEIQANYKTMTKNTSISDFQFITNDFSKLNELEQIQQVCEAGAKWVQLRLKNQSEYNILQAGKQALKICQQYQAKLIINDHAHLVKEIGAHGVHLGKADMSPIAARELLGREYIIGGTANNIDDIRRLHQSGVDYIGLGPFRFTQTKKNLAPVLGLNGYKQIIEQCQIENIHLPIVAIGGINIEDVSDLVSSGLHGIALSSAITSSKNLISTTTNYLKQLISPLCKN